MGALLWAGIGDTIRVSLSADPVEEVKVGFEMLKSLGLRTRGVNIVACPSCARQGFDVIKTVEILEQRLSHIHEPISLSIIGCVVNGPGEAALTDLGFTGGGKESGKMFVAGRPDHNVSNADMIEHIVDIVIAARAVQDHVLAVERFIAPALLHLAVGVTAIILRDGRSCRLRRFEGSWPGSGSHRCGCAQAAPPVHGVAWREPAPVEPALSRSVVSLALAVISIKPPRPYSDGGDDANQPFDRVSLDPPFCPASRAPCPCARPRRRRE
jgi:hypothetical protein